MQSQVQPLPPEAPAWDLGNPTVEHRFLGMDRRLILPTLAILLLTIFWGGFIPWLDETIEGDTFDGATVLTVNHQVEFTPSAGWLADGVPTPSQPKFTVYRRGVSFTVAPGATDATPSELLTELLDSNDYQTTGERQAFTFPNGIRGEGVNITGIDEDGVLFALVSDEPWRGAGTTLPGEDPAEGRMTGIRVEVRGPADTSTVDQQAVAEMLASITVTTADEAAGDDSTDGGSQ